MILLLDNYDSFTYNLLHYLEQVTDEPVVVKRNNEIAISEVEEFSSIILSPGPGLPTDAGVMMELIKIYGKNKPILGICLGHQGIGEAFGGKMVNLEKVLHGVKRKIIVTNKNDRLFNGIDESFSSGHYHSWVISSEGLSEEIDVTAIDSEGNIMAISHRNLPVSGVQFHPESVMTDHGLKLIHNWVEFCVNRKNVKSLL